MRKLLSTTTAACGVALTLGMLAGGTAAAAPTPGDGHPGHGHAGQSQPGQGHKPGGHQGTGHKPGGHKGGHKGHKPGGHKPGGGHQGGGQPGGAQPGGGQPGGGQPGGPDLPRAAEANPGIVGGQPAERAPWAAQVSWGKAGFQCSGSIIAPEWVLTARHCVDKGDMAVKVGSTKLGEGQPATVDRKEVDSAGDMALLHLDHAVKTSYAKLADSDPKPNSVNEIYGWGSTEPNAAPSPDLLTAKVKVTGMNCKDAFDGRAICSTGMDGSAYYGDSGGPEMADGTQVGVCSTGDGDNKSQQYASVAAGRNWIRKTAGV